MLKVVFIGKYVLKKYLLQGTNIGFLLTIGGNSVTWNIMWGTNLVNPHNEI